MIPNGYPEAVKWRTEKKTKCQAMEYKKLHRILTVVLLLNDMNIISYENRFGKSLYMNKYK
jgi:hypothetical protein